MTPEKRLTLEQQIFVTAIDNISSVIRHKGESRNRCYKKTKDAKFSEKQTFLPSLIGTRPCAY